MMDITKNIKEATAITHGGTFHADEIMATVILEKVFGDIIVCRTFRVPEDLKEDVIVYDIGFGAFDHHQKGGNGARENGVPYAACGLIWKEFGPQIVANTCNPELVWNLIDRDLIQGIDAGDNGAMPKTDYPAQAMSFSAVISGFNPNWDSNEDPDEAFAKAVELAEVVFDNVDLTYKGAGDKSLSNISFTAPAGSTIGIIGGTGSGKSSLVNLIPRFYDATSGSVNIDGKNVKDYKVREVRNLVGIVMQKAVLFKGSIRDNMKWGNDQASDEEINFALENAQAAEVVAGKEGGLDYMLEQNGRNLSGGQKQRFTIARALVRKPKVLILDDSASALDFATDAKLRKSLKQLGYRPTTFIVSQRTSSIQHADMILVLDDGKIVGKGTHDELLKTCEVYNEIYMSQFKDKKAEGEVTA